MCVALVAVGLTMVELFPQAGHLEGGPTTTKWLIEIAVAGIIATVVVLIFRVGRGELSLKVPIPGTTQTFEFSGTQTPVTLWCLVYIVVKLF